MIKSIEIGTFFMMPTVITIYDKDLKKDIKVNSGFSLNAKNWYEYKGEFLKQRSLRYDNLTQEEIASKEIKRVNTMLSDIENTSLSYKDKDTFETLANRYVDCLKHPTKQKQNQHFKYTPKEVKIAYFCLGERITEYNYLSIINKYTDVKSKKILQEEIVRTIQLTSVSENKGADTKHKTALINAERLLSGINNKKAIISIRQIISTFESNYDAHYK